MVGLPLLLWAVHHRLGHDGDIGFFHEWYLAFREGGAFYRDGPGVNYPFVGVLIVCAPSTLVELALGQPLDLPLDLPTFRVVHKATLVLGDIGFVFAAAALARTMRVPHPRRLALWLYLCPSSWAVGAWFGQIDLVVVAFLLAAAAHLVRFSREGRGLGWGLAFLHLALLSKQLAWFALPAFGLLVLFGLRRWGGARRWAAVLLSPLVWLAPDPLLTLPAGQVSHLAWVVTRSVGHVDYVVGSGASVWSLFVQGGVAVTEVRLLGLDARAWSWIAWLVSQATFAAIHLRRPSPRRLLRFAGFALLAMATLLTGVHERYIAQSIPLLLLVEAGPRWRRALGWATGVVSGLYVLGTILGDAFDPARSWLLRPEPVVLLALAWLVVLLAVPLDFELHTRHTRRP